ncbi:MAG: AzlC family ABC transporter permease [Clostridiales bacterium]|nr:AzlC family ABC transporter permease [Clostridiales bacterium]
MNEFIEKKPGENEATGTFIGGIKDAVPTMIGYISIGIAAGVVGAASNLSVLEVGLLSLMVYAGAAQFIICALLAAGSPPYAIIFTTFIVNLRLFLLNMALAPSFSIYTLFRNIRLGALVTDETFGVASGKLLAKEQISDRWMSGLNIAAYISWVLACMAGAAFEKWIANPQVLGLDFALTAMFVALLVLQIQNGQTGKLKLYLTLVIMVVLLMFVLCAFFPSYIAIILSTVVVATFGVLMDR